MNDSKKWWKSRSLWGVALALMSLVSMVVADSGAFELAADLRPQLMAVNLLGLGLAGFGRVAAKSRIN